MSNKKPAAGMAAGLPETLAFGELALLAGALEAELLAFFLAGVTAEQVGAL